MEQQRAWRSRHEERLVGCEDGTAVFQVFSNGVAKDVRAGDPAYQRYLDETVSDVGGIVWLAEKSLKRLQKEHRKVSRFLARREKKLATKDDKPVSGA